MPQVTLQKKVPALSNFGWRRPLGWLILGLSSLLVLLLAYQAHPFSQTLDVGSDFDSGFLSRFYNPESNPSFTYRWTRSESYLNLYQVGTPYQLSFRAVSANPSLEKVEVNVIANGQELGKVSVGREPEVFNLRSSRPGLGPEDLTLTFRVNQTFAESGNTGRKLGVVLDWVKVEPYRNRLGLIIPPPFQLLWWLGLVWWPLLLLRFWGLSHSASWGLVGPLFNLLLFSILLLLPATFAQMHTGWWLLGLQLGVIELGLLVGWLLVARWRKRGWSNPNYQNRLSPVLLLSLVALAFLYLASFRGHMWYYGDDRVMQAVTSLLVSGKPNAPLTSFDLGNDVPTYSPYGIGQSLAGMPLYLTANWATATFPFMDGLRDAWAGFHTYILLFTNLGITVGSVWLLYWIIRLLGFGSGIALATAALYGLGTMAWHYSRTYLSEPLVAFSLLFALVGVLKYWATGRWYWAGVSGFMLGLALATRINNLVVLPFFGLYLLWAWWEQTGRFKLKKWWVALRMGIVPGIAWGGGIGFWLLIISWYNSARYSVATATGYNIGSNSFDTPLLTGLYGQLFSTGKSIFLYNPVLILGLLGLPWAFKKQTAFTLLSLGIITAYLVLFGIWLKNGWVGGGVWGPRFLVPIIPLFLWPVAYVFSALAKIRQTRWGWAVLGLIILVTTLSIFVQFLSVVANYEIYDGQFGKISGLFQRALYNWPDSPLIVQYNTWQANSAPDFAFNFYKEGMFARWVETVQKAAFWLFFGFGLLAAAYWLRLRAEASNVTSLDPKVERQL